MIDFMASNSDSPWALVALVLAIFALFTALTRIARP